MQQRYEWELRNHGQVLHATTHLHKTFFSIRVESLGVEVLQRQELFVKINKRLSFLNFGHKSKLNHLPIKHEQVLVDIFGHYFLSIAI